MVWMPEKRLLAIIVAAAVFGGCAAPGPSKEEIVGYKRPFGPRAPWNVPVKGLERHPGSERYGKLLWDEGAGERPGNFNLNVGGEYTYPVYYVSDATDTYTVEAKWVSNISGEKIPWNPEWKPNGGTDGQIILLDEKRGIEIDFWQAEVDRERKIVRATNCYRIGRGEKLDSATGNYWKKENGFSPARGIGIQYLAMLGRPEEIALGAIEHALSMPVVNTSGKESIPPATKIEHPDHPDGVPEGMRFALDVTDGEIEAWLAALPPEVTPEIRHFARIVAVALRDYGWFTTDTSGGAHLQFEARESAAGMWEALGIIDVESKETGKTYPRDLLDGLVTRDNIYVLVGSDNY